MHGEVSEPVGIPPDSKRRLSDRESLAFATANPELNVERTAEGEMEILAAASRPKSGAGFRERRAMDRGRGLR